MRSHAIYDTHQHQDEVTNFFTSKFEANKEVEADEHQKTVRCVERLIGNELAHAIR